MLFLQVINKTQNPLPLINLSVPDRVLPVNEYVVLTPHNKIHEIQSDPQLQQYLSNGSCVLNDGERDLSQEEALNVTTPVVSTANIFSFNEAPEKEFVHENDIFLVEDSEDTWRKKKVKSSNVIFVGAGTIVFTPECIVETALAYTKSKTPIVMYGMEKVVEIAGNYEIEFNGQFACLRGSEVVLVAIFVDDTMLAETRRIIEAESYVATQTDALIENLQIGQTINIRWWTNRGKRVITEARSMKVRRYV